MDEHTTEWRPADDFAPITTEYKNPTEQDWAKAQADADTLEAKLTALIDEFESKHTPIQVRVITRWPAFDCKYSLSKGGAAQVKLKTTLSTNGIITICSNIYLLKPKVNFEFTEP